MGLTPLRRHPVPQDVARYLVARHRHGAGERRRRAPTTSTGRRPPSARSPRFRWLRRRTGSPPWAHLHAP